jgi:hypothetical protein
MTKPDVYHTISRNSTAGALAASCRYVEALKIAASVCISVFNWMRHEKSRYVPLLDFDVIRGASTTLTLYGYGIGEKVASTGSPAMDYSGPSATRFLLETLPEFVLPPGTIAETISECQQLSTSVSLRSETFLRRIRQATMSSDSMTELLRSGEGVDIILEDLSSIARDVRSRELFQSLLRRAHTVEEYVGDGADATLAKEALQSAYRQLAVLRPDRSLNNMCDALNAAALVQMREVARYGRTIPLLVSNTRDLRKLASLSGDGQSVRADDSIPHLVDKNFLIVSQGILHQTDGRYIAAIDEAMLLDEDVTPLVECCQKLLNFCRHMKSVPINEITVDMLPSADWEMLLFRRSEFERRWSSLFGPQQSAARLDRTELIRLLGAHDWAARLCVDDRDAFNRRLLQFRDQLGDSRPADYEIWSLIMNRANTMPEAGSVNIYAAFDVIWKANDGVLLSQMRMGQPATSLDPEAIEGDHNLQVVALPCYLSAGAAVIVCSFRDSKISPRRYLRFTWLHELDVEGASKRCIQLVQTFERGHSGHYGANVFKRTGELLCNGSPREVLERIQREIGVESIQVLSGRIRSFADVVGIDDIEMQIGITLPDESFSESTVDELARIISETSVIPIVYAYARNLVEEFRRVLFVRGIRPSQEIQAKRESLNERCQ